MTPAEAIGVYLETLQPLTLEAKAEALGKLVARASAEMVMVQILMRRRRDGDFREVSFDDLMG